MVRSHVVRFFTLVLVVGAASIAHAGLVTPTGLNPGDSFRFVFVTSTGRDAVSSDIADYDSFVTQAATAAGLTTYGGASVTWMVIASTPDISARDRITESSPALYLLNGVKVADDGADLWDGSIDHRIDVTETGSSLFSEVWTGTDRWGNGKVTFRDERLGGASDYAWLGYSAYPNPSDPSRGYYWIDAYSSAAAYMKKNEAGYSFYAVSSVLTVPNSNSVPEPASLAIWSLLGSAGAILGWRRHRRTA